MNKQGIINILASLKKGLIHESQRTKTRIKIKFKDGTTWKFVQPSRSSLSNIIKNIRSIQKKEFGQIINFESY